MGGAWWIFFCGRRSCVGLVKAWGGFLGREGESVLVGLVGSLGLG
jgi:hypothetical protein